jgi:hypothetical protein
MTIEGPPAIEESSAAMITAFLSEHKHKGSSSFPEEQNFLIPDASLYISLKVQPDRVKFLSSMSESNNIFS